MDISRDLLIQEASILVDRDGIDALNLQLLARQLGIQAPSLYNHVSSLAALKEEVAQSTFRRLVEAVKEASVGRSGPEALAAMAEVYRSFAMAHPHLYMAIEEILEAAARLAHEETSQLVQTIDRVLEPFQLGKAGTVHFSRAFRSAMHGFIVIELMGFKPEPDPAESFRRMIQALIISASDKAIWNDATDVREEP